MCALIERDAVRWLVVKKKAQQLREVFRETCVIRTPQRSALIGWGFTPYFESGHATCHLHAILPGLLPVVRLFYGQTRPCFFHQNGSRHQAEGG